MPDDPRDPVVSAADLDDVRDRLAEEITALRTDLDRQEPVISAAVLASTAWRLKDRAAQTIAMRILVRAVRGMERAAA